MSCNCRLGIIATGIMVLFAGCNRDSGPKLYGVTGRVTYQDNPVVGATVTFVPAAGSMTSYGTTDAEGKFTLKGSLGGDGAPLGAQTVTVTKSPTGSTGVPVAPSEPGSTALPGGGAAGTPAAVGGAPLGEGATGGGQLKSELPEKYSSIATSGLTFTVTDDPAKNNFEIVLTD